MQKQPLSMQDFRDRAVKLDLLRCRGINVVFANAHGDIKQAFQGYDNMGVDLENLLGIRIALENGALQNAVSMSQHMGELLNKDDLDLLRQNVVQEFGAQIWPEGEMLGFNRFLEIMIAAQESLAAKEQTIINSVRSLRWDFEEATAPERIEAVCQFGPVNAYNRLRETLVHLVNNGAEPGSFAAVDVSPPLTSEEEYKFALAEIRQGSLLLPEIPLQFDSRPVLQ